MRKLSLFVAMVFLFTCAQAQTPEKAWKKFEKAKKKAESNKTEDAKKMLKSLTDDYPAEGKFWDYWAQLQFADYMYALNNSDKMFDNMTISVDSKDGDKKKDDSLATAFMNLFKEVKPSKLAMKEMLRICREGMAKSEDCEYVNMYVRLLMIDQNPDTLISDKAHELFLKGEAAFQKRNYADAMKYYKEASDLEPKYFKAKLYVGDAYYGNQQYEEALKYYKDAVAIYPASLEGRKYVYDVYYKLGLYDKAYDEALEALFYFPEFGFFYRLDNAARKNNKAFNRQWMAREVLPLQDATASYKGTDKAWLAYIKALSDIKPYCNSNGIIIKQNDLTSSKYAEVYAWEKLLEASPTDPKFETARKMKTKGYLDCYCLFSLYHVDNQAQYRDFVSNNRGKWMAYINSLMYN